MLYFVHGDEAASCQEDYNKFLDAKNVFNNDQQELWATKSKI